MPPVAVTPSADGLQQAAAESGEDPDSPRPDDLIAGRSRSPVRSQPRPLAAVPTTVSPTQPTALASAEASRALRPAPSLGPLRPLPSPSAAPRPGADDQNELLIQPLAWLAGGALALVTLIVPLASVIGDRSLGGGAAPSPAPVPSTLARDGSPFPAPISGPGARESVGGNSRWQPQ